MLTKRKKRATEIKTKRTFARRSAQFCDELERHHPTDLPRLLLAALKRLARERVRDVFGADDSDARSDSDS